MNSPLRALLFLALVLGIAGAIVLSTGGAPRPALTVQEPALTASQEVRVAAEPSQAALPEAVMPRPQPAASVGLTANPTADSLAGEMHALEDSDPERALELAERGQALWPAGPRAPEFAASRVKCLYRLDRPSEGRGAAEAMVNKYPTSPWALEVERQTGAHPHVDH